MYIPHVTPPSPATPITPVDVVLNQHHQPHILNALQDKDIVLESVMHPLDSIRRRWISNKHISADLEPSFSEEAILPPINDHLEGSLRIRLGQPLLVSWSEVSELSYCIKTSLTELLGLLPEEPSLVGSIVPQLLLMEHDYLRTVLRVLTIPEEEITALLTILAEFPPPAPNDIDFRWKREKVSEDFLNSASELLASKLPEGYIKQHRQAVIGFLGNGQWLSNYSDADLAKAFIMRTAFAKRSPIMFDGNGGSFQVTRLNAHATFNCLVNDSSPLAPEFIEADPLISQCWRSSLSIPLKTLMSESQKKTHPQGKGAWQGILQLIFGFRQLAIPERVSATEMAAFIASGLRGICDFSSIDQQSINASVEKLSHPTRELALALARRAANSFPGQQSCFVPLLHSAIQMLCSDDSVIAPQELWDTTMSYIMNPAPGLGLKSLASSKWDEMIKAQPPLEGLLLKAISYEHFPAQTAMNLLQVDTFLKLFCEQPKNQATPLRLREHADKWVILHPMHSESVRIPFAPQAAVQNILKMAQDPRTNDTLFKLLQLNPPPPLRGPAVNSLHRFASEHAITSDQLGAQAKLLLQAPSKALHYLGLRYLCLALLMGPSTPESIASMTEDLLDGVRQVLQDIKDPTLLEPLLSDLEKVLPLFGFGVLVEMKPDSAPSLPLLRKALAHHQNLPSAWLCTLAGSSVQAHRINAQHLWRTLLENGAVTERTTIGVIKTLNQQDPTAALSILRRAEKANHLKPEQCLTLFPSLQKGLHQAGAYHTSSLDKQIKSVFIKLVKAGEYIQAAFTFGLYDRKAAERLDLWNILLEDQITNGQWQEVARTLREGHPGGNSALLKSPAYKQALVTMIESDLLSALNVVTYYPKTDPALILSLFEAVSRCHHIETLQIAEQWLRDYSKPADRYWPKLITAWASAYPERLINLFTAPLDHICGLVDSPNQRDFLIDMLFTALDLVNSNSDRNLCDEALKGFYLLREAAFSHFNIANDSSLARVLDLRLSCSLLQGSPELAFDLLTTTLKACIANEENPSVSAEVAQSFRICAHYLAKQDKETLKQMGKAIGVLWHTARDSQHVCELLLAADALSDAGVTSHIPILMSALQNNQGKLPDSDTGVTQIRAAQFLASKLESLSLSQASKMRDELTSNRVGTYFDQTTQALLWNRYLEVKFLHVAREDASQVELLLKEVNTNLRILLNSDSKSIPACLESAINLILDQATNDLASFEKLKKAFFNALPKTALKSTILQTFLTSAMQRNIPPHSIPAYLRLITPELDAAVKHKAPPDEPIKQALMGYVRLSIAFPAEHSEKKILAHLTPKILSKHDYAALYLIVNGRMPKGRYNSVLDKIYRKALDNLLPYQTPAAIQATIRVLNHIADSGPIAESQALLLDCLDRLLEIDKNDIDIISDLCDLRNKLEPHMDLSDAGKRRSMCFLGTLKAFDHSQLDSLLIKEPTQAQEKLIHSLGQTITDTLNHLFLYPEYVSGADVWKDLRALEPLILKVAHHDASRADILPQCMRQASASQNRDLHCSQLWNSWVTNLAYSTSEKLHAKAHDYFEEGISRQWMQECGSTYEKALQAIKSLPKQSDIISRFVQNLVGITSPLCSNYSFLTDQGLIEFLRNEHVSNQVAEKLVREVHESRQGNLACLGPLLINLSCLTHSDEQWPLLYRTWELCLASLARHLPVKECIGRPLTHEESAIAASAFDPPYQQVIHRIITKRMSPRIGLSLLHTSLFTHLACQKADDSFEDVQLKQLNDSTRMLQHVTKNGTVILPLNPSYSVKCLGDHASEEAKTPIDLPNTLVTTPLLDPFPEELASHLRKIVSPTELQNAGLHILNNSDYSLRYLGARLLCLAALLDSDQSTLPIGLLHGIPTILDSNIDKCALEALVTDVERVLPLCNYEDLVIDGKDEYCGLDLIRTGLKLRQSSCVPWILTLAASADETIREEIPKGWCKFLTESTRPSFDDEMQQIIDTLASQESELCLSLLDHAWDKNKISAATCFRLANQIEEHIGSLQVDQRINTRRALQTLRKECCQSDRSLIIPTTDLQIADNVGTVIQLIQQSSSIPNPADRLEHHISGLMASSEAGKKSDCAGLLVLANYDPNVLWDKLFPELADSHVEKALFFRHLIHACVRQLNVQPEGDTRVQMLMQAIVACRWKLESLLLIPETWSSRYIIGMDIAASLCRSNDPLIYTLAIQYGTNALYVSRIVRNASESILKWDSTIANTLPMTNEGHEIPSCPTQETLNAVAKEIASIEEWSNLEEAVQGIGASLELRDAQTIQKATNSLILFFFRANRALIPAKTLLPLAINLARQGVEEHLPTAVAIAWAAMEEQQKYPVHQRDEALHQVLKEHLSTLLDIYLVYSQETPSKFVHPFQDCLESTYAQSILSPPQQADLWNRYLAKIYKQPSLTQADMKTLAGLNEEYSALILDHAPRPSLEQVPHSVAAAIHTAVATKCSYAFTGPLLSLQDDPVERLFNALPIHYYKANATPKEGMNYSIFFAILEKTLHSLFNKNQVITHLPYCGRYLEKIAQHTKRLPPEYLPRLKQCMIKYIALATRHENYNRLSKTHSQMVMLKKLKDLDLLSDKEKSYLSLFVNECLDKQKGGKTKQKQSKEKAITQWYIPAIELALTIPGTEAFGKALSLMNAAVKFGRNASHLQLLLPVLRSLYERGLDGAVHRSQDGTWGFKTLWDITKKIYAEGSQETIHCHGLIFNQICSAATVYRSLEAEHQKIVQESYDANKQFHDICRDHILEGLEKEYYTANPQCFWDHLAHLSPILISYLKDRKDAEVCLLSILDRANSLPIFQTREQQEARVHVMNRWIQLVRIEDRGTALAFWNQVRLKGWYIGFEALHEEAKQVLR